MGNETAIKRKLENGRITQEQLEKMRTIYSKIGG